MALTYSLTWAQGQAIDAGTLTDGTNYGSPEIERSDVANFLLVSSNNKNGDRSYLGVVNTDPLTTLVWAIQTSEDGWHQATLLSIGIWNSSQEFVPNDVAYYQPTGKVYKATQTNTNVAPDSGSGPANWEEVGDLSTIQQGHTNLDVFDYDFLVRSRVDTAIAEEFDVVIRKDFSCKMTVEDAAHPLNLLAMMLGAETKMLLNKPDQADEIVAAITECVT